MIVKERLQKKIKKTIFFFSRQTFLWSKFWSFRRRCYYWRSYKACALRRRKK